MTSQTNRIEAIRVKLKSWENPDLETLILLFEKVPTYTAHRDFTKENFPVSVFTDFGYVEITLKGQNVGDKNKSDCWLNEYIDNDEVFIEEEVENDLTFWDGQDESRYDWSSGLSLSFSSKSVRTIPLNSEEWKELYVKMTLKWEKLYHKRHDLLEIDFLEMYTLVVKGEIFTTMLETTNPELLSFKTKLASNLDDLVKSHKQMIKNMERMYSNQKEKIAENKKQEDIQKEVNNEITSFWRKLINTFKK